MRIKKKTDDGREKISTCGNAASLVSSWKFHIDANGFASQQAASFPNLLLWRVRLAHPLLALPRRATDRSENGFALLLFIPCKPRPAMQTLRGVARAEDTKEAMAGHPLR